ncbi:MAG: Toxin 1, PIN domain [uncultured Chloroflexi bacterium]|uniref:Ribonuclease VapC n=1 Tax=uncultured Chloroflexota bacterium TaxID=166587 RepID=A0A6J4I5H6_9CHLR|nr:MAG: Toxin 1, PIN domain [uncultured Chloroflexota bacterium]
MILPDVNVLVYAHRGDAPDHARYAAWLEEVAGGDAAFGLADLVLSGFLRVVTHPRVFTPPTPLDDALGFVEGLRARPNYVPVAPGPRHWELFTGLCRRAGARGNLIPDAYLAALAIESGSEWITSDRGFARFSGLRWRHPLDGA